MPAELWEWEREPEPLLERRFDRDRDRCFWRREDRDRERDRADPDDRDLLEERDPELAARRRRDPDLELDDDALRA